MKLYRAQISENIATETNKAANCEDIIWLSAIKSGLQEYAFMCDWLFCLDFEDE